MSIARSLYKIFKEWLHYLIQFLKLYLKSKHAVQMENIALRSQLALYVQRYNKEKLPKPRPTQAFRQLWVFLTKQLKKWQDVLVVVKPDTVIRWHRTAFKIHWRKKSKKVGRPKIQRETIELIKRYHEENALLSPEKIHERLVLKGVIDAPAPNTIAKYLPTTRKPPSDKQKQSWLTFLKNHSTEIWATDFFTIPTLTFKVLHVLVIIHHKTRKIIHFNITINPTAEWTIQQFRHATPYGKAPKYLIHDNDPIFCSKAFQFFLNSSNITTKRTTYRSPWQNPYAERVIGTIKRECTDHTIPINEKHIYHVLHEYIYSYYNTDRTHQGLDGNTPIPSPKYIPVEAKKIKLKATPIMNGLYHTYKKVA